MRRRSLALALSLLLPATAFAQAQPQAAPTQTATTARSKAPVVLTTAPADWRALDGQHVRIAAPLTLAGTDGLERFGQLTVAFDGRLWQPTEVAAPGTAGIEQVMADNQRRRLVLDDGSDARDPGSVPYLAGNPVLRTGMQLRNVEGIVRVDAQGRPSLQVEGTLTLPDLQRPAVPKVAGDLHIAAFNLENFFNGDGQGGGFPTLRGARTLDEHKAQVAKLVATISALDAHIAALMELENDGYGPQSAIAELLAALNATLEPAQQWAMVDAGEGPGTNPIRVGIIYRKGLFKPLGAPLTKLDGPFAEHSRAPLAQAFQGNGAPFMVVANHFKSKGCRDAAGADADRNDGQGCWNATRVESARQLNQWVGAEAARLKVKDIVLLGDFNAYAQEDPIRTLHDLGWQDAFKVAKVEHPYSYVYNGYTGRLDHALLSPGMAKRLRGAAEWHSNADEQDASGYQGRNVPGPWRSSDHDPLLLGFGR
ncbi:endonuclease [Stenotrophomonas sp. ZAC14D1_NAIMI4_6]|uniref:ExeM/NucH family extracellular endonuclease n=1 Tax=unclassified Stenotrophomonas maltophilia group TaxID=2961925 RepID=UPI000D542A02|nr:MULTISPECIES: ExeM/NucH family extracellular endonuclease [unclassified Stenotrophomonas maltophilia group]AWH35472.1 endonuclease [Stenotrophomonas sp. ZAC14D1_NAIMI4_6]AWH39601.1 endonuclease [Stenotrophomonas sp. ZAC14D1_NAIMI4_1]